jgi:hypothetical protein
MNVDREMMDSLKKERGKSYEEVRSWEGEESTSHIDIEEERRIWSQYMIESGEERSARKAAESDMRDYQKRAESSKGRIMTL